MPERLAWPLRLAPGGRLSVVEQDSDDDIRQCVRLILVHRPGDRDDLPGMAIADPTHGEEIDVDAILEVVERHEPRATIAVGVARDEVDRFAIDVTVGWDRIPGLED